MLHKGKAQLQASFPVRRQVLFSFLWLKDIYNIEKLEMVYFLFENKFI